MGRNIHMDTSTPLFDITLLVGTSQELYNLLLTSEAFVFDMQDDGKVCVLDLTRKRPAPGVFKLSIQDFSHSAHGIYGGTGFNAIVGAWFTIKLHPTTSIFVCFVSFMERNARHTEK